MTNSKDNIEAALRALASDRRLQILAWLKDPEAHFPAQVDGDLVKDGVCGALIAEKLGVSQPTVSDEPVKMARLPNRKTIFDWWASCTIPSR